MDFVQYYRPVQVLVFHSKTMSLSREFQPAAVQLHSVDCEIDLNVDSSLPHTTNTHGKLEQEHKKRKSKIAPKSNTQMLWRKLTDDSSELANDLIFGWWDGGVLVFGGNGTETTKLTDAAGWWTGSMHKKI